MKVNRPDSWKISDMFTVFTAIPSMHRAEEKPYEEALADRWRPRLSCDLIILARHFFCWTPPAA
jgi:hypothetical protein